MGFHPIPRFRAYLGATSAGLGDFEFAGILPQGWCPSIAWMKGLQRVVDRLRIEPVAKGGGAPDSAATPPRATHGLSDLPPAPACRVATATGASAPGRSRCRPPRAHAVMEHDVVSGPAQPARLRAPGEGRRAAAPRARQPWPWRQGRGCRATPLVWIVGRTGAAAPRTGPAAAAPPLRVVVTSTTRPLVLRLLTWGIGLSAGGRGGGRGATGAWEGHAERGGALPHRRAL